MYGRSEGGQATRVDGDLVKRVESDRPVSVVGQGRETGRKGNWGGWTGFHAQIAAWVRAGSLGHWLMAGGEEGAGIRGLVPDVGWVLLSRVGSSMGLDGSKEG